ncbi:MAG: SAM-dependent methyltransferase [Acidobacteria bacterium]|nr:MAG: SAM-dependent methyltransferase [Acidobacteriota bacterium]
MSIYQDRVLPYLIHLSMRQGNLATYRQRLLSAAEGRILEIGVGSGHNFRYYSERANHVIGLDPSPKLLSMARETIRSQAFPFPVELLQASAEAIPLRSGSLDTVVTTWTLCTIPNVTSALAEMCRVLKPDGRFLFVEHGLSPDPAVRRWQDRLTPIWKRISGGCHLNRAISQLVQDAGFRIDRIETGYMKGLQPMTYMYEGFARPA